MKKVTKLMAAMAASALVMGALTGCGGEKKAADSNVIKIGGCLEMTGGNASFGISAKKGIDLALAEINKKGVLGGKKLELVVADTKSEASEATNAMQKLISQDKVVAVIGPNASSAVIASGAINNSTKVLDITPMGTNPAVTVDDKGNVKPYSFRACFIDPFQGTVMANYLTGMGLKKAAVYIDNSSDYSKGLAKFFKENFEKNGGSVVIEEAFLAKDTDFKATLTKIKATNPDVVYIPGYYQEVGLIVKQAREMGIDVPMCGGDGWDAPNLAEIAGAAALNNTFFCNLYSPDDTSDLNKKFVADFKQANNGENPNVFAALAHDCALLVAKAIEDAGSADPAKINEAMAKIKGFPGVAGEVTFDQFHNPVKSAVIIEHVDGKQTFKASVAAK